MVEITSIGNRRSFISENINRITKEIKDMETGIEEAVSNSGNIDKLVFGKQQEIEQVLQDIEDIKLETARISEKNKKRKAEREELSVKNKECLAKREELAELASELDKECFRLGSQRDKLEDRINSYTEYMW